MVLVVLWSKHIETRMVSGTSIKSYTGALPDIVPLDITEGTVVEVGFRLSGEYGLGGVDTVSIQHWLICYREANAKLQQIGTSMV